ncbi:MAG: hypothetical protein E6J90_13750 [Deltaproteobacteria bacterium]|nr:MAG: hypothetical protein E6J91_48575 [Deltaproteobacteria bacterium]TMQ21711.1 MAG: hypothetical protein E6J90_13750 [Deltaproteobacteria bacterium]
MSKLLLLTSLTLFVSLAACMERGGEATSAATEAITDDASELVAGTDCLTQLTNDNDACTAAYNACMAGAVTWWDKAACATTRAACMAQAAARFVGCIRGLLQPVPAQPAGQPVPATEATKTGYLEDRLSPDARFTPIVWFDPDQPFGCAST